MQTVSDNAPTGSPRQASSDVSAAERSGGDNERRGDRSIDSTTTANSTSARRPGRALTADFLRVWLFTIVVVAHTVNGINSTPDVIRASNLIGTLCHISRYGFVAVTLYVLVLSMRGKEMSPLAFWRKRFGLIVAPYLVWTVVYAITDHLVIGGNPFPAPGEFFAKLGHDLLVGEGKYQLYFLLISMQIYLVFPALNWLLKKTMKHPWWVLGAGAAIQITMFVIYQYLPRPAGDTWAFVYHHGWKTLPMYALFIAIGALAAVHHRAVDRWLRDHVGLVIVVSLMCVAFSIGSYIYVTSPGTVPPAANTAWNPATLPYFVGGLALMWLVAMGWDDLRKAGRAVGERAVSWATLRAFGVFAVHPLILDILGRVGFMGGLFEWFPHSATIRSTVLVLVVLAASLLLVDILIRLPLSKWLVARPRLPLLPKRFRRVENREEAPVAAPATERATVSAQR